MNVSNVSSETFEVVVFAALAVDDQTRQESGHQVAQLQRTRLGEYHL